MVDQQIILHSNRHHKQYVEYYLTPRSRTYINLHAFDANEGKVLLEDIHSNICDDHAGAMTMVGKAYRQGFF